MNSVGFEAVHVYKGLKCWRRKWPILKKNGSYGLACEVLPAVSPLAAARMPAAGVISTAWLLLSSGTKPAWTSCLSVRGVVLQRGQLGTSRRRAEDLELPAAVAPRPALPRSQASIPAVSGAMWRDLPRLLED